MYRLISALMFASLAFSIPQSQAQAQIKNKSGIQFSASNQIENEDLMNLYRFQNIQVSKVKFSGQGLWGKDFRLYIQEVVDGKPQKRQQIFDSREDEFFKIKEQEFAFSVLAQRSTQNKVRIDFRFLGYGFVKEFTVKSDQQDFTLKSAQDSDNELEVPIGTEFNFLSFSLPYKTQRGAMRYSELEPFDVRPESMGKKFGIPRYFLMQIEFK